MEFPHFFLFSVINVIFNLFLLCHTFHSSKIGTLFEWHWEHFVASIYFFLNSCIKTSHYPMYFSIYELLEATNFIRLNWILIFNGKTTKNIYIKKLLIKFWQMLLANDIHSSFLFIFLFADITFRYENHLEIFWSVEWHFYWKFIHSIKLEHISNCFASSVQFIMYKVQFYRWYKNPKNVTNFVGRFIPFDRCCNIKLKNRIKWQGSYKLTLIYAHTHTLQLMYNNNNNTNTHQKLALLHLISSSHIEVMNKRNGPGIEWKRTRIQENWQFEFYNCDTISNALFVQWNSLESVGTFISSENGRAPASILYR